MVCVKALALQIFVLPGVNVSGPTELGGSFPVCWVEVCSFRAPGSCNGVLACNSISNAYWELLCPCLSVERGFSDVLVPLRPLCLSTPPPGLQKNQHFWARSIGKMGTMYPLLGGHGNSWPKRLGARLRFTRCVKGCFGESLLETRHCIL